ncbi:MULTISPECIES: hypothetical protein [unclassified Pseudoxanthomonas]|uniref:hypothetical protein n=1 Tax=unclassified Pseudoxanthomonas TaxID=2645906 RepID=UPI0008F2F536|nr:MULTISPECIES: hypothetical protein [unclassified Pseudoxanthomonas]PPJ43584.1 hypothetical protein C0063_10445 [Pseudoxanthomonas sp. KAs_5_3]SFV35766.1 hypothetical protein SAMN05428990_3164 [Pseudoxanthomonas sp. YR558]
MGVRRFVLGMVLAGAVIGQALAKDEIQASAEVNPPPAEALAAFDRYELRPATLSDAYAGHKANQEALASFQRNLDERVGAWAAQRNAAAATHTPVRTLVVEPRIEKIRFISGGARFWAGALAGSSRILVTMKLTDAATGQVIATPEFYQHAKGMAGAWTFGAADNSMLVRSASLALDYLKDNQATAQGGRTGWEKE